MFVAHDIGGIIVKCVCYKKEIFLLGICLMEADKYIGPRNSWAKSSMLRGYIRLQPYFSK